MNNKERATILIVEDEIKVLEINARIMKRRGYNVVTASTCAEAYEKLDEIEPQLLILDIMLPDGNGLDICEKFRKGFDQPILFLTGKSKVTDKIEGLSRGGDYYLTKPYDIDELLAVVKRLIEREFQSIKRQTELTSIERGCLTLDILKSKAIINGNDAGLTSKEFALLHILMKNEENEVSPQELYEMVWGVPTANDVRTVRTHIKNLRRKINADSVDDYDIVSNYGKGYVFTTMY